VEELDHLSPLSCLSCPKAMRLIRGNSWQFLTKAADNLSGIRSVYLPTTSLGDYRYLILLCDLYPVSQIVEHRFQEANVCVCVCVCALQLDSAASVLLALASISIPLNFVAWSENVQIFAWGFRVYRVWLLGPGCLTEKGEGWGVEWCYTFIWSDYPRCIYREYGTNECFSYTE
jgi:hypothetical protein